MNEKNDDQLHHCEHKQCEPHTCPYREDFATKGACETVQRHVRSLLSWAHIECFQVDDRVMEDLR